MSDISDRVIEIVMEHLGVEKTFIYKILAFVG